MERCLTERRSGGEPRPANHRFETSVSGSSSPEETEALGHSLARCLKPGMVIALQGSLGVGKTCLAKGIARGLGITENITSPTYTIISEYPGTIPLYHIDAYRLNSDDDFENTGAGEYIGEGVTIIEWPDRIPRSIPSDAIMIQIEVTGPYSRIFRIEGMEL